MSFLTRSRRRLAAGFAVAALAFAHVAIAAHGCLQDKMPEPQMACDEHHQDAPNDLLCRAHFQAETQTLDLAKVPQLSPFNAPVLAVERAPSASHRSLLPLSDLAAAEPRRRLSRRWCPCSTEALWLLLFLGDSRARSFASSFIPSPPHRSRARPPSSRSRSRRR